MQYDIQAASQQITATGGGGGGSGGGGGGVGVGHDDVNKRQQSRTLM